jgi:glycerol-3-phosphate acyltransferase PlsY
VTAPVELVLAAAVGYLIGSLPLGFLIVRRRGVDLRRVGSGNVGATNVHRAAGPRLGVVVLAIDLLKGVLAVLAAGMIVPADEAAVAVSGVSAVLGHCYPIWLRFGGGKGVAVAAGVFVILAPLATGAALAVFAIVVGTTKFVSLGSILATVTLAIVQGFVAGGDISLAATVASALILFRHRGNMSRLLQGREPRLGGRGPDQSSW